MSRVFTSTGRRDLIKMESPRDRQLLEMISTYCGKGLQDVFQYQVTPQTTTTILYNFIHNIYHGTKLAIKRLGEVEEPYRFLVHAYIAKLLLTASYSRYYRYKVDSMQVHGGGVPAEPSILILLPMDIIYSLNTKSTTFRLKVYYRCQMTY